MIEQKNGKNVFNIYGWKIQEGSKPASMCSSIEDSNFHFLVGVSDQYEQGISIYTSRLLSIDFVEGIAETKNSFYRLKKGKWKIKDIKTD